MNGFVIDSSKVLEDLRSQLLAERKKRFEAEARSKRLEAKLREKLATDDGFVNGSPISTQASDDRDKRKLQTSDEFFEALYSPEKPSILQQKNNELRGLEYIDRELKLLEENEVHFEEPNAAAPTTWQEVEDDMFGQKELRAQHTQLVEQLTLSEASRIELQQQNDVNSKKIATLEKELAQSQKFMDKMKQVVLAKNASLRTLLMDKRALLTVDEKYRTVGKEKLDVEIELETVRRLATSLADKEQVLSVKVVEQEKELIALRKEVEEKDSTVFKMAQKLIDLKSKLNSMTHILCKYYAKRIYRIYPSVDASIVVMHDGTTGQRSLHTVLSGKATVHAIEEVYSLEASASSETRMTITYANGESEIYELELRDEAIKALTELVFEDRPMAAPAASANKETTTPKHKKATKDVKEANDTKRSSLSEEDYSAQCHPSSLPPK